MGALECTLMGSGRHGVDGASTIDELLRRADAIGEWCPGCGRSRLPRVVPTWSDCVGCDRSTARDVGPWPLVRLGRYEGRLREVVLSAKRDVSPEDARALGRGLGVQWRASIEDFARGDPEIERKFRTAVIQPVPMPWLRRWERGADHARVIARGFADATGLLIVSVIGQRWGPPRARQRGLDRRAHGAETPGEARFYARRSWWGRKTRGRSAAIIVDDVRTSGSTLRAMAQALRSAGFGPIAAAVVAVSHHDTRPP